MSQNNDLEKLPSFLVIGAPKAGTTSIHEYLLQHPGISLPLQKETHFFDLDISAMHGPKYFSKGQSSGQKSIWLDDLDSYLASFVSKGPHEIRGEVCPSYLTEPNTPANIKRYIPDVKLIAILRNPVDRLYSWVNFLSTDNNLDAFKTIVERALIQKDINLYEREIYQGFYADQLKRYFALFPRENLKIYLFEDFARDPQIVMSDILSFIGITDGFEFDTSRNYNPSGKPRLPHIAKHVRSHKIYRNIIRKVVPYDLFINIKSNYLGWMFQTPTPLPPDLRKSILSIYRDDILELQALLKLDLSSWLNQ